MTAPDDATAKLTAITALCRERALYVHLRDPDLGLPPEAVVRVSSVLEIAGEPVEVGGVMGKLTDEEPIVITRDELLAVWREKNPGACSCPPHRADASCPQHGKEADPEWLAVPPTHTVVGREDLRLALAKANPYVASHERTPFDRLSAAAEGGGVVDKLTDEERCAERVRCEHYWAYEHAAGKHLISTVRQCMLCHEIDRDDLDREVRKLMAQSARTALLVFADSLDAGVAEVTSRRSWSIKRRLMMPGVAYLMGKCAGFARETAETAHESLLNPETTP